MDEQMQNPQNNRQVTGSAWWGIGLAVLLHLLQIPIAILVAVLKPNDYLFIFPMFFIGVSQLVYMIPAMVIAHVNSKPHILKGLLIGASITFLLNAACTGMVFLPQYFS